MSEKRQPSRIRMLAIVVLAYALAVQGLLGAMGAGAQAGEARLAAQLGVICTIHGVVDPATGMAGGDDPTPGRLACVEHCLLTGGMGPGPVPTAATACELAAPVVSAACKPGPVTAAAYPSAAPPPPRGPPSA
jgi:hypothetical protein